MRYSIEGGSLPAVIIQLDPGETIISEAGARTWSRGPVVTEAKAEGGVGKSLGRMFTGESLFMSRYTAQGPVEIAFSSSFPGSIVARALQAGESIICQKSAFLCATLGVELSMHFQKKLGAGLVGGEGFIMQRVTGPGMVFLEVDGHCQEYDLAPGEPLVCDTGVLAIMDDTCQMDVQMVKGVKNVLFGGEGLFDTVITGPGKVHLQTMTIAKLAKLLIPFLPIKK
ncbi:MAG TPA: AIM24 family protein [Clostridia bacterium]|nr:AIM24 family protein [Clostridia bacterium]